MSKLSFRARHLDPSKQMPIYLSEELPDLPEYSAINRAVPQMPSGMEKEEESEHHLQRAICTGLIIPTPEVLQTDQTFFDAYYPPDYKMPRQMIHMQPLGLDTDVPDYDMDSVDKDWLNQQQRLQLTELKFEQMMDRLEKSSGQTVVTLNEAKTLLNQDDETSISVYDYWLNKRLKTQHPLILIVKTESRPGASSNNPYLAFRRRTEKMQTRKNRKNDEASYEKMLKLRRDLQRATTILEMVRRREETKRDHLKTTVNIFEKRVEMRDFNGAVYSELNAQYKNSRPVYNSLYTNQYSQGAAAGGATATGALLAAGGVLPPGVLAAAGNNNAVYASSGQYLNSSSMTMEGISAGSGNGSSSRKEKRPYKKRKHKLPREKQQQQQQHSQQQQQQQQQPQQQYLPGIGLASSASASGVSPAHHLSHLHHLHRQSASPAAIESNVDSEEDDYLGVGGAQNGNKLGSESEEEAPFAFRRKISCNYLRMRGAQDGRWPWEMHDENDEEEVPPGAAIGPEAKYRYTLTSVNYQRPRCIGFARRRLGRGGRVLLDRARSRYDDLWSQFDYTVLESVVKSGKPFKHNQQLLLPKPSSPPTVVDLPSSKATVVADNGNVEAPLKVEPAAAAASIEQQLLPKEEQQQPEQQNPETREAEGDEEEDIEDEDELCTEDENVSRLSIYSSAVTLQQSPYDQRMKRRRLRRKKQQLRELNAAKRLKSAVIEGGGNVVAANVCMDEVKPLPLRPLPRAYLHRLAIALHATTTKETTTTPTLIPELQTDEAEKQQQEQQLELKQEICDEEQLSSVRHANHQNHRSNNNNNTVLNNNNNNNNNSSSNSNMNKNVSISEKFNVIKVEETIAAAATDADAAAAEEEVASTSAAAAAARAAEAAAAATTTATATNATIEDVARTIKRELIDADDSNEPLSSIRTAATMQQQQNSSDLLDDDEAEDDVNLAQLSSIIRHTAVKKELQAQQQQQQKRQKQEELQLQESQTRCFNQMPDVIRLHNKQLHIDAGGDSAVFGAPTAPTEDDECFDYMGGLSPTSSQRLDICNELLSEIRRDWLHFRPKTPTDELSDSNEQEGEENSKLCSDQALVDWTQDTPISLEMSRLGKCMDEDVSGVEFMSSAFKYTDLDADAQLLQTAYALDYARQSPDNANNGDCSDTERSRSGSGSAELEFNLSGGASLNDINNLLGDDHMLVNILQECSMDDPKALNQTTNFWNGILEGEGAAVVDEVENAENLLDCKATAANATNAGNASSSKRTSRHRTHHHAGAASASIGSSSFTVAESPVQSSFFSQTPPVVIKQEQEEEEQMVVVEGSQQPTPEATPPTTTTELASLPIKLEPMEMTTTTIATAVAATATPITLTPTPTPPPPPAATLATVVATPVANVTIATPQLITVSSTTAAATATTTHLLNIPAQITTQRAQQQQQQQKVAVTQQLLNQFNATPAATATQLIARSELVSSAGPAVGDIVTISPHTGDLLTITPHTSSSSNQQQQQQQLPTLSAQQQQLQHQLAQAQLRNVTVQQRQATPQQQQQQQPQQQQQLLFQMQSGSPAVISSQSIVTSRSGNHMIYTTSSGEIVGGQKVTYAIQKSGGGSASIGPNTVITLSNVKLQNDDNNGSSSQSSNPSSVNIINTASGQQLAVHSISGIQQQQQQQLQQQQTTSSTPLIVTTPARNNNNTHQQQLQVQQQQQQQQPIVWRQVSGTNTAVATTAVLSTTATSDSPTAVGNKILWTSRATQKRQLNGPENTDINKLLLNRKFSQRKVGQQAVTQQQIQLTKQQLQQLVQQEDELVTSCSSDQLTMQDGNDAMQQQQQQQHIQQHQQLQKFSKVIKMAQFPLLVSDLNLQQQQQSAQQQQQQKPNSAAAIAANHNYSLQPATAIITSQAGTPQQANKIFLTSSNSSGGAGGNFTIATASELQAAVAGQQKLHYKELPNSNLKLNFVTSASVATMNSGDTLVSQASQQLGATTVVLNKTGAPLSTAIQQQQHQQQQQQQHQHHQKLKTSGGGQVQVPVQTGDKRVLYTSLLNVKPLQKNNSGQMQMQLGPAGLQQVLRGRLNNSAILTRTLPIGTTVNSTGGGGGTPTTIRQLVTSSSNNNNNASSNNVAVAAAADAIGKAEVNKTQLTVEQVIASANNGGVVLPTSTTNNNNSTNNNNNNNSNSNNNNNNANSSNNNNNGNGNGSSGASGNSSGAGGGGGVNATTSNVNVSATPTINR